MTLAGNENNVNKKVEEGKMSWTELWEGNNKADVHNFTVERRRAAAVSARGRCTDFYMQ